MQHLVDGLGGDEQTAAVDPRDHDQVRMQRRHYTEVGLAAAQRPERSGNSCSKVVRSSPSAVTTSMLADGVGGVAVAACEDTDAAAERVRDGPDERRGAVQRS